jgi:biotin/methionine sulfoxide reductase
VSWDRALDLLADELTRVKREHGNGAIFGGSYGWSSAGRFHHAKTQLSRLLAAFGGYVGQRGNYSFAASSVILPHVLGYDANTGETHSWGDIAGNTDLWIMFGGLPARNIQVSSGGMGAHRTAVNLERTLRDGHASIVNVNPCRTDAPTDHTVEWLPIRPGTDTALGLAFAHTWIIDDSYDKEFVDGRTVGFERFASYLLGDDGAVKDAAWAAEITGIPESKILSLARRAVRGRTLLTATWSLQRADHGEQPYWLLPVLAAMLGQIGLPGGGFGFGFGSDDSIGTPKQPFAIPALSKGRNPLAGQEIPVARVVDMLVDPGGTYVFDGAERTYPDIKLVYWAGGNPFHHHQDLNRLIEAWQLPDTIVVHEQWWTAAAKHADIVLPATTTLERNDIGAASRDRFIIAMKQAIEPVGQARSDFAILADLATRLGIEEQYSEGRDEFEWLRHLYERSREAAAVKGIALDPFDAFWDRGQVELGDGPHRTMLEDFRSGAPLRTPSGRLEIFSETIDAFGYDDCPGHPAWLEPSEWLGSPLAQRFPLHMISNQPGTRLHSQMDMGVVSVRSKVEGREPCRINRVDAERRGIAEGDVVELFNDRGSCLVGAVLTDDLIPGVIALSTGAWLDRDPVTGRDVHGNPNSLTHDRGTSQLSQGPSAHSVLVQARLWRDALPAVRAFEPPTLAPEPTLAAQTTTTSESEVLR